MLPGVAAAARGNVGHVGPTYEARAAGRITVATARLPGRRQASSAAF